MHKIKDFFRKHNILSIIIVSLVFGLGGGISGEIIARAYLADANYNLSPFGDLDFSSNNANQGLVISNARNVIVEQDAKIDETINSMQSSLVGIYKKQKTAKPSGVFSPDDFYKLSEAAGQGFIITSDGWIATSLALEKIYDDYVVIARDKKIYLIDRAVSDSLTEFNFIQVAAKDFPVRKFAEPQDIKRGNLAVGLNWQGLSLVSAVVGYNKPDGLVRSSDNFSAKLVLNHKIQPEFKGSIIFNLAGEALGLVDNRGEIEPSGHLNGAVKNLFKNKTAARPMLGVNYIDLSGLAGPEAENNYWQKGAIIYKDQRGLAVRKNSPAAKAGLRQGDIIISVDNVALTKDNDLADVIQNYLAGDKLNLVYWRNGQEKEVEVTLEELK